MSFCKRFAERRARHGMSLVEVMVSQTIALVVITAMMSLVVAMVKRMQSETAASDAQVRLRQASHLLLRDTQGIGGSSSSSGDLVFIVDGGSGAADEFTIFKRDESVCGGGLELTGIAGVNIAFTTVDIDPTSGVNEQCPVDRPLCPASELAGRTAQVVGPFKSIAMTGHTATASSCMLNFPKGQQATDVVASYNARFGASMTAISQVLGEIGPTQVLFGSSFTYRVRNNTLQRSTDRVEFIDVLTNVFDLQVLRVYATAAGTTVDVPVSTGAALPAGITEEKFLGLRLGLVTFAATQDGMAVAPPSTFGNRTLVGTAGFRYRASFVFAASRNRSGV